MTILTDKPRNPAEFIGAIRELRVVELDHFPTERTFLDQWQMLWGRQEHPLPFSHPVWVREWWKTFNQNRELVLLSVWRGPDLLALAPLYKERVLLAPATLRVVGYGTTNDYNDWLINTDEHQAGSALLQYLHARSGWRRLEIGGVLPESNLARLLPLTRAEGLLAKWRRGLPCPYVTIGDSWDSYLAQRPRTLRYHLRSRLKRLAAEIGPVEFRSASGTDALPMLEDVIDLHARSWDGQENDSIFSRNADGERFYRTVLPTLVNQGVADITGLYAGKRLAAAVVGFQWADRYGYYIPAYDPDLRQHVPGKLLVGHLMARAHRQGQRTFDFMLGTELYKYEWATSQLNTITVVLVQDSLAGRALMTAERTLRHLNRRLKDVKSVQRARAMVKTWFSQD